jgi:hypothetical protein
MTKKKLLRIFPTIVIFTAVGVSFLSNFYEINIYFLSDIIGYSIPFNLVIIYFLKRLKYCIHTIIAMYNLTVLNMFNILNSYNIIDYDTYYVTYDCLTLAIMFLTMLIYSATKNK